MAASMDQQFTLHHVSLDHPALRVAMPLVSTYGTDRRCIGTAFLVKPGLAITASHVVHDWRDHEERRLGHQWDPAAFSVMAVQCFERAYYPWSVENVYDLDTADIAFLQLRRPDWWGEGPGKVKPPCARLSMSPPRPGEEVNLFGFPDSRVENNLLVISPAESVARVRKVALKSNLSIRPTSWVELDGEIRGGMSGGPCFDKDWNVVGMCSKGWNFLEDVPTTSPLSYMALLWPAMSTKIDLFKTGPFPVWDLFKTGAGQALGGRRVHVTSQGRVRFGVVDPTTLVPLPLSSLDHLEGAIGFALDNARQSLVGLKTWMDRDSGRDASAENDVHRCLRHFFWELESALALAVRLAAKRAGFSLEPPMAWERLVEEWQKHDPRPEITDALASLRFSWDGIDLFEIRTYAEQARSGILGVTCVVEDEVRVIHSELRRCRKDGNPITLPDGLDRYVAAVTRFLRDLLRVSRQRVET